MIHLGHIDLNVVEHCNLKCRSCSHGSPLAKPWTMPLATIERDLSAVKPFLRCESINVVGGEPTLRQDLHEVLRLIKRIRIDTSTVVITNGTLLKRQPEEFWQELEYLTISAYPDLDTSNIDLATEKSKQYQFGFGVRRFDDGFYVQLKKEPNDGVKEFNECVWKKSCRTIHDGHFYLCPQSCFFPSFVMGLEKHTDGLPLDGITEEKLQAFLDRDRDRPFNACKVCTGGFSERRPWTQSKRSEWVKESTQ